LPAAENSRLRRALTWPARRLLDPRVEWTVSEIDDRLGSEQHTKPPLHDRFDRVQERLEDLDDLGRQMLQALGHQRARRGGIAVDIARLDPAQAAFLNWADSPFGYAAQAGLWFNPPVPVEHRPGGVDVLLVNERIIEQPYVFAAVAAAAGGKPQRVLDVGGAESTVGLSLASLGHDVTIVDPRGCRLAHPQLTAVPARLEDLPDDGEEFDIAVVLSAIEHFGLEHYGTPRGVERADLEALAHIRRRLRPGGTLVLTVPIGTPAVDAFQRTYDLAGVRELVADWEVRDLTVVRQRDRLTWVRDPPRDDDLRRGVALVSASR
jgi:SAM-dependent methyltransferase